MPGRGRRDVVEPNFAFSRKTAIWARVFGAVGAVVAAAAARRDPGARDRVDEVVERMRGGTSRKSTWIWASRAETRSIAADSVTWRTIVVPGEPGVERDRGGALAARDRSAGRGPGVRRARCSGTVAATPVAPTGDHFGAVTAGGASTSTVVVALEELLAGDGSSVAAATDAALTAGSGAGAWAVT